MFLVGAGRSGYANSATVVDTQKCDFSNPNDICSSCLKAGRPCGPKLLASDRTDDPPVNLPKFEIWDPKEPLIPKIMERTGGRMTIDEVVHKLRQEFEMIGVPDPPSRPSVVSMEHQDLQGYRPNFSSFVNTQTPLPDFLRVPNTIDPRRHVPSQPPPIAPQSFRNDHNRSLPFITMSDLGQFDANPSYGSVPPTWNTTSVFEPGWRRETNPPQVDSNISFSTVPVAQSIRPLSSTANHLSEFNEDRQVELLEIDSHVSRDPVNESNYDQVLSYEDDTVNVSFSLQFPHSVSRLILNNISVLKLHVQPLPGVYYFEAGYDVVPDECQLGFPEQASFFSCICCKVSLSHF